MEIKTVLSCPLGHSCREIKGAEIHQCAWLTKLAGKHPGTGERIDEEGCAMGWLPILLIENAQQQRSTAAAVESFRNESIVASEKNHLFTTLFAEALRTSTVPQLPAKVIGAHLEPIHDSR